MTDDFEPCWWSWTDIVKHSNRLGIPNFQRGAVWDDGNRVALLESMYEQSPCGTFVLWTPTPSGEGSDDKVLQSHGVPLREFSPRAKPMWLVDGQQRTRAMLDTFEELLQTPQADDGWSLVRESDLQKLNKLWFHGSSQADTTNRLKIGSDSNSDETKSNNDEEGNDDHVWMVVLPAMSVFDSGQPSFFGEHSEARNVRRGSLFRRLSPRARTHTNSDGKTRTIPPLPVGMIPLATLLIGSLTEDPKWNEAQKALQTFADDSSIGTVLDELLPWGPQFVTGYAFESHQPNQMPQPITWANLHARRDENITKMVGRLAQLFSEEWNTVIGRFQEMLGRGRFAVGWLPRSDVSAAIDAYIRINRAGIRVRPEERALALLSRARPQLLDDLARFTERRDGGTAVPNQRALLSHHSDKQMGFALWITVVTRYTALAVLGDTARRWLGVTAIDKDTFEYRLDRVGPHETDAWKKIWAREYSSPQDVVQESAERASEALLLLDSVLSVELFLDHRMARQSTRALYPLLDLFYRIPAKKLRELSGNLSFRSAVARLLHWTMLSPYIDQADLERLVIKIHKIDESPKEKSKLPTWANGEIEAKLKEAFTQYQDSLKTIWQLKRQQTSPEDSTVDTLNCLAVDAFASEVRDARSLQHPAVGWLYAIERRNKAQEFSWIAQVSGYENSDRKRGVALGPESKAWKCEPLCGNGDDRLYPEKQHIVPFSIARQIVNKGGTRATASPSNAIGNLTWLSRRQNGLDALSDRWTVMDPTRDLDNLKARGMLDSVLAVYEKLSAAVIAGNLNSQQKNDFDELCASRTTWMVEQMTDWLNVPLPAETKTWLTLTDAAKQAD